MTSLMSWDPSKRLPGFLGTYWGTQKKWHSECLVGAEGVLISIFENTVTFHWHLIQRLGISDGLYWSESMGLQRDEVQPFQGGEEAELIKQVQENMWGHCNAVFYSLPGFGASFMFVSLCLWKRKLLWGMYPGVQLQWFPSEDKSRCFWWGRMEGNSIVSAFFFSFFV